MKINDLEFITGDSHKGYSDKDIGITLSKKDVICVTVRNDSIHKIAQIHNRTARFLMIAFADNRLYFKGTDNQDGFTVTSNPESKNKYIRINLKFVTDSLKEWILENEGQYDLRFDDEAGLYYISNELQFMTRGGKR